MRIGIFTDAYEPHTSGVTTSINMLKASLENMHHEVFIVTANLEKHQFIYNKDKKIIYIPGIKTGIYNTRLTNIYSKKAFKIIKEWHLDVIHSQTEFGIGMFSRIVAKKLNIPVVHTYHTLYEDYVYYVTHGHFDNLGKKLVIKLTKYFCDKKCDELIVPTPKIKELFETKYNITRNINVIPTGIDTTKFEYNEQIQKNLTKLKKQYKLKDTDFLIGSVGRIAKEKSFDILITTFKNLVEKDKNIKLIIVGDGPIKNDLEKLVQKLNLEKNVIFTGLVNYDLIPTYYNLFDCLASFSKTETQGLTIIEALAASTPVVCINDTSFMSMIQNKYNGFLFNNNNEFIEDILTLKENKQLIKDMKLNAKNSIYKYSKEVFASDILKLYSKAIENHNK